MAELTVGVRAPAPDLSLVVERAGRVTAGADLDGLERGLHLHRNLRRIDAVGTDAVAELPHEAVSPAPHVAAQDRTGMEVVRAERRCTLERRHLPGLEPVGAVGVEAPDARVL